MPHNADNCLVHWTWSLQGSLRVPRVRSLYGFDLVSLALGEMHAGELLPSALSWLVADWINL